MFTIFLLQEIQQAADFLEIPYLSKAVSSSVQQLAAQNENPRSYLLVIKF